MLARNKKRSNRRPDTLMQDRQPPDRKTSCDTPPDHTLRSFRSSGTEIQFHWSQRQSSRKCQLLRKLEGFWPWRLHGGRTFAPLGETHKSHCMNARTVIVAGRQPTSRSRAGSYAPRNRHRTINHSLCLFFSTIVLILFSGQAVHVRGDYVAHPKSLTLTDGDIMCGGMAAQSHGNTPVALHFPNASRHFNLSQRCVCF